MKKNKIGFKAIAASLACALTAFIGVSCAKGPADSAKDTAENVVNIWGTYATEKVLQNVQGIYDDIALDAKVDVGACRGEYESAQIIISPKRDVKAWSAKSSNLTSASGAVFSSGNIELRAEKYVTISRNYEGNGAPVGNYPDCLIPIKNYVASGQNSIKGGENQGLYVTFNVPLDQAPGIYTGTITLTVDGKDSTVPVTLEVYNLTVSEVTHSKSKFNIGNWVWQGELDSSWEMYEKYVETLAEYRLSTLDVMYRESLPADDTEKMQVYCEEAAKLCENPKMSNFGILSFTTTKVNPATGQRQTTVDATKLANYIEELAKAGIRHNLNTLAKAIFSASGIDEPESTGRMDLVKFFVEGFEEGIAAGAAKVEALIPLYPDYEELLGEMVEAVRKIPFVITVKYNEALKGVVKTWCPVIDQYDSPEKRDLYDADENILEKWWYTAINPRAPYPTYHIEDTLVSARALSWMMNEYGVVGNLYWGVTLYGKYTNSTYNHIEDYWGEGFRYAQVNGEGFLFYPGAKYGVYGPLASMRLEAIRDGLEEYELLYALDKIYEEKGFDKSEIQRSISSLVYTGTKVASTSETFALTRRALIQLALLAQSEAGVLVTDAKDDGLGTVTYKVLVGSGYTLTQDGAAVDTYEAVSGGNLYTVTKARSNAVNDMSFAVTTESGTYAFSFSLGGKVAVYGADSLSSSFVGVGETDVTSSLELLSATGANAVKLEIGAVEDALQRIRYTNSVLSGIGASTEKLILRIYNPSDNEIDFTMNVKYQGDVVMVTLAQQALQPKQINVIEITGISAYNWDRYKKLDYCDMYFNGTIRGDADAKTLYLCDVAVYDI